MVAFFWYALYNDHEYLACCETKIFYLWDLIGKRTEICSIPYKFVQICSVNNRGTCLCCFGVPLGINSTHFRTIRTLLWLISNSPAFFLEHPVWKYATPNIHDVRFALNRFMPLWDLDFELLLYRISSLNDNFFVWLRLYFGSQSFYRFECKAGFIRRIFVASKGRFPLRVHSVL